MMAHCGIPLRFVCAVALLLFVITDAQADVLNMPAGETSLQTVFVGDPGNAPDTAVSTQDGTTGYGEVDYTYSIGACTDFCVSRAGYVICWRVQATGSRT
jgi:hypothetical protein